MIAPKLIIGGVEIALQTFPASQDYDVLEGATVHRMLNGAAAKQSHWRKITTRISGDGWAPAALAGVDWTAPVEISCIQARAIHSATVNATLPAARRSDLGTNVYCRAVVNGELVETPVSVNCQCGYCNSCCSCNKLSILFLSAIVVLQQRAERIARPVRCSLRLEP